MIKASLYRRTSNSVESKSFDQGIHSVTIFKINEFVFDYQSSANSCQFKDLPHEDDTSMKDNEFYTYF
jgi:hypothetical protein